MEVLKKEELKYGKEGALVQVQEEVDVVEEVEREVLHTVHFISIYSAENVYSYSIYKV